MTTSTEKTIGQVVADDYRAAAVFESYGIDFCCKGNTTIDEACAVKGIDKNSLLRKLDDATKTKQDVAPDHSSWPLDLLADYIEKKHHRYVEETSLQLKQYLDKLCTVHGKQHPELFRIKELFNESAGELTTHMKKEELVLFPFIRKMVFAQKGNVAFNAPSFGSIQHPIEMMKHDHTNEGERFRQIAELTGDYTPPAGACNTYKTAFALLKAFEEDLHLHIHLENNVLFPRAIELEKEMERSAEG